MPDVSQTVNLDIEKLFNDRREDVSNALNAAFREFELAGGQPDDPIELVFVFTDGCGAVGCRSIADFQVIQCQVSE